ncbi:MAG: hypothetical protein IKO67_05070 [Bacteroidaceae bacterium]|nr:hypothetical protein [Bacteroidaceae bacterium]
MTFSEAVKAYRSILCKAHLNELDNVAAKYAAYQKSLSPTSLKELAEVCVEGNHQHRIHKGAKIRAIGILEKNLPTIFTKTFANFEQLYDYIKNLIGGIDYIGLLTIYDVSLRIGHLFSKPIYPKKFLYLNSGAYLGARKMIGGRNLGHKIPLKNFFSYPQIRSITGFRDLQSLPNSLVEDFLCVMHNYLDVAPKGLIAGRNTTSTYKMIVKYS